MQSIGIVRSLDELGRLTIPREIIYKYGWDLRNKEENKKGTTMEFFITEDGFAFKEYIAGCKICGQSDNLVEVNKLKLCSSCITKFNQENYNKKMV